MPLTLNTPKALVPILDKPLLFYLLEEAALSGMKDVVFITNPGVRKQFEAFLGKTTSQFPELQFHLYDQLEPWGHGRAILSAYEFLKGKPFIIRFSDDLIFGEEPVSLSLSRLFDTHQKPIMLLEAVPPERASLYGVVGIQESLSPTLHRISKFVEKPKDPPSNLSVVGGYVFTPDLLEHLRELEKEAPQVPDGLLISDSFHPALSLGGEILGWQFPAQRFDCGNLEGLHLAEEFLKKKSVI